MTAESRRPDLGSAEDVLRGLLPESPEVLLVLGSGLSGMAGAVERPITLPFSELVGFPPPGVAGHAGRFVVGRIEGRGVLVQAGRFHLYEGHRREIVVAPLRIAARLGIRSVILTNASGGIHPELRAGSIVLLDDHLNWTWDNPLVGERREDEERFPDMSRPYDRRFQELALAAADRIGIRLFRGTYGGVLGPSYETPAEVEMLARMGADVVGMSTVPEVLAARALNMRVLALSLVTNRAASRTGRPLTHREVLEGAAEGSARLERLIREVLRAGDGAF